MCGSKSIMSCHPWLWIHDQSHILMHRTAGGGPLPDMVTDHIFERLCDSIGQAHNTLESHAGKDSFQHQLVEVRLGKIATRIGGLAGDRFKDCLHVYPASLHRRGEKPARIRQERQCAQEGLLLPAITTHE